MEEWKPKYGEMYFTTDISSTYNTVDWKLCRWTDTPLDRSRLESGVVFKTKKEAIETGIKLIKVLERHKPTIAQGKPIIVSRRRYRYD